MDFVTEIEISVTKSEEKHPYTGTPLISWFLGSVLQFKQQIGDLRNQKFSLFLPNFHEFYTFAIEKHNF